MSELRELYQEMILDHGKAPRNLRGLEHPTGCACGHNPLCGDRVRVYVDVRDGTIRDLSFEGSGCAICMASASMMTEMLVGRSLKEAEAIFDAFHALLTGEDSAATANQDQLEKLIVFAGVREFPIRVKCATLAWHTFNAALKDENTAKAEVSTE